MHKPETLNDPAKLRELSVAELRAADHQLKEQQMKLRLQHAIGQVEKTHLIREARRQRARVLTLINEKLRHIEHTEPVHAEPAHEAAHAVPNAAHAAKPHAKKTAARAKGKAPAKKAAAAKKPAARKAKPAKAKPAAKKGAKKK